jgi:PAS domain S-box-containing protein
MLLQNTPIRQKLMTVILITSGTVLLLMSATFAVYEFVTFRQATVREVTILGEIIAANCTAALAFDDTEEAAEILSALKAEAHIEVAILYDSTGNLFSTYPSELKAEGLHGNAVEKGYRFEDRYLTSFQPVTQGNKRLGTLYLKSSMQGIYERLELYGITALIVIAISFLLAYILSKSLQETISKPILSLSETAKFISQRKDYAVRAKKWGEDEMGLLTDAFNQMLVQIEKQTVDLRESEERIRDVINSALSAVVVMDAQGTISEWNTRAEKMFGWPKDDAIGKELADLIVPEDLREAHRKGLKHFLATGEGPVINQFIEISALRRGGMQFPVELSISVLRSSDAVTFCGFITDITERKRAEEEIKAFSQKLEHMVHERTMELENANKELESFSYSVSHDLRAPLRSIHGYINIFAEEYSSQFDDEAKRLVSIITNNAQKMGRLIDDLLAFSQLGRKELTKTEASMMGLVQAICEEHKRAEANRNIEFIIHELPVATVDITSLRQVWVNLISNAVKYTQHKNDARIEIGANGQSGIKTYFVKDNGAGFDMQYYNKLFGVFQRLHSQREFEGTGVGLAIVQRIVSKHGGKVWAEAKPNEGATFYFTIPDIENNSATNYLS